MQQAVDSQLIRGDTDGEPYIQSPWLSPSVAYIDEAQSDITRLSEWPF